MSKNGNEFWKLWNDINKVESPLASRINDETDDSKIADEFATYFELVYGGANNGVYSDLKNEFIEHFQSCFDDHINDNINHC